MTATGKLTQRVGQTLKGRYRIDRALHSGAESTVYAGMDLKSGRVAIKVFERLSDESRVSRSYLANAVGHPSAVNVLDSGSHDDGTLFVVLELIEASSMAELLSKYEGHLPVRVACNIADQALDLLASAHAQGIVHGELSAEKLFYTRADQLKALGFGKLIATAADAHAAATAEQSAAYADDVRSVARVVAQLLVGKPVDTLLLAEPTSGGAHAQPSSAVLPRRIASVIQKGLTNDAAQHWQSARAMRTALQLACQAELGRPVDRELRRSAAASRPKPRTPRRGLWLAAAGAVVGSMLVLRTLGQPGASAPEADLESDSAAASQLTPETHDERAPERAFANDTARAVDVAVEAAPHNALTDTRAHADVGIEAETQPASLGPRKPSIPALRVPLREKASVPSSIAPADALCAQLAAARRARTLNEEEAQLWLARCGTR